MSALAGIGAFWRAYLCGVQGHTVTWNATSTSATPHAGVCTRCGSLVIFPSPGRAQ